MDARRIVIGGRFGRRLLWCTLGALLALGPGATSASADGCSKASVQYPTCQNQVQAPVTYSGLESRQWAYYCGGDHPHFYDANNSWDFDPAGCFTALENPAAENDNFDGTFTNWCLHDAQVVVTLGCLPFNPN
jgi:hypothetical protein